MSNHEHLGALLWRPSLLLQTKSIASATNEVVSPARLQLQDVLSNHSPCQRLLSVVYSFNHSVASHPEIPQR